MKIEIEISDIVQEVFLDNLYVPEEVVERVPAQEVIKAFITNYLNESIDREDLDMYVAQYLDGIEGSGEMEDIYYELTLDR